jgi:hypothetical protein
VGTVIDRKGRRKRTQTVEENAMCKEPSCPKGRSSVLGEDLMTIRQGYAHHDATGHTVVLQRIKLVEVSKL